MGGKAGRSSDTLGSLSPPGGWGPGGGAVGEEMRVVVKVVSDSFLGWGPCYKAPSIQFLKKWCLKS